MKNIILTILLVSGYIAGYAQIADKNTYLSDLTTKANTEYPNNKSLFIVFHGHSVPSGYFNTPIVNSFGAYPIMTWKGLSERYPNAVINCIVTGIGGEHSESGANRFENTVLNQKPDILFIDYAINDRGIGLDRAKAAWIKMIESALSKNIKVILLTPSPVMGEGEDIVTDAGVLAGHAAQIRELAAQYKIGVSDSYNAFKLLIQKGNNLSSYMSHAYHPNVSGHEVIKNEILTWFPSDQSSKEIKIGKKDTGEIKIFPNPSNTDVIELQGETIAGSEIKIYDPQGKFYQSGILAPDFKINIGNLPMGAYILTLTQNEKIQTASFIKKNQ